MVAGSRRFSAAIMLVLTFTQRITAATSETPPVTLPVDPVTVLVGTQAVLHLADMVTTVHALNLGGAREGNPYLSPLTGHPTGLAAVSSAVDAFQMVAILRLRHQHPRTALVWALVLVGAETWTVTRNVHTLGDVEARARLQPR